MKSHPKISREIILVKRVRIKDKDQGTKIKEDKKKLFRAVTKEVINVKTISRKIIKQKEERVLLLIKQNNQRGEIKVHLLRTPALQAHLNLLNKKKGIRKD
jgi:hypothetical protein